MISGICAFCKKPYTSKRNRFYCSRTCSSRDKRTVGGLYYSKTDGRYYVGLRSGSLQIYSRALMEGHLCRDLEPREHVHHVNGDKSDDRIENLVVIDSGAHTTLHLKERWAEAKAGGRRCGPQKLTVEDVAAIRVASGTLEEIGARFGTSYSNVSMIRSRKTWA